MHPQIGLLASFWGVGVLALFRFGVFCLLFEVLMCCLSFGGLPLLFWGLLALLVLGERWIVNFLDFGIPLAPFGG